MCLYALQNAGRQGDGITAVFPRHQGPLAALHALDEVLKLLSQLVLAAVAIPRLRLQMPPKEFILDHGPGGGVEFARVQTVLADLIGRLHQR